MSEFFTSQEHQKNTREQLRQEINDLLVREKFFISPEDEDDFEEQIRNSDRHICIVGQHQEGDELIERFLKILVNDNPKVDQPFACQVAINDFLKKDGRIKVRGIITANIERQKGTPFAMMETFTEEEAEIGFIDDEEADILTPKEAQSCVRNLLLLKELDLPPHLVKILPRYHPDYDHFCQDIINEAVTQEVNPLDNPTRKPEPFHMVLNRRLGIDNFKEKMLELLEHWQKVVSQQKSDKNYLAHKDLGPGNLYIYNNGEVEFLDWEYALTCQNPVIATIIDFGNLRARVWNNKEFRKALDEAMIEAYRQRGQEEVGKAIVSLGILRSHCGLAGFFENYDLSKQREAQETKRRESTEADIVKAWEVAGLKF